MTSHPNTDVEKLRTVCCGDESAVSFLLLWSEYVHAIDDIVDLEETSTEFIIATFGAANRLYAHPFYLAHLRELHLLVQLITNAYADAEHFAHDRLEWKRQLSDVLRHAGAEMLRAVCFLCGGYAHLRSLSAAFHETAYYEHHTPEGAPR